jgi:hypothetical protein
MTNSMYLEKKMRNASWDNGLSDKESLATMGNSREGGGKILMVTSFGYLTFGLKVS